MNEAERRSKRPLIPESKLETRKPVEVAAGLVFRAGKLLITRRHPDAHLGGLWEFPGGKRQPPESFEECLIRELREELAIEVGVDGVLETITHSYPEQTVCLRFYRCRWRRGEPQALGCSTFKWIGPAELTEHEFPAADARLIRRVQNSPALWL
jgi:8-oxo-dGTP diphosphatase